MNKGKGNFLCIDIVIMKISNIESTKYILFWKNFVVFVFITRSFKIKNIKYKFLDGTQQSKHNVYGILKIFYT